MTLPDGHLTHPTRNSLLSHVAIRLVLGGFLLFSLWTSLTTAQAQNPLDRMLGRSGSQDSNEVSEYQETIQLKQRLEELEKDIKEIKQNNPLQRERFEKEATQYQAIQSRFRELPKQQRWRREDKLLKLRAKIAEMGEKNETILVKLQSLLLSREQSATNLKELLERYLKFREDAAKWLQERYPKKTRRRTLHRDLKRLQRLVKEEKKRLEQAQTRLNQSNQDIENTQQAFDLARKKAEDDARLALDYEKTQADIAAKSEREAAEREAAEAKKKAEEENNPRRLTRAERLRASREASERARREVTERKEQEKLRIQQEDQRMLFQLASQLNRITLEFHRRNLQYLQLRRHEHTLNHEFHQTQHRFYLYTVEQMQSLKRSLAAKEKGGLLYHLPLDFQAKLLKEVSERTLALVDLNKNPLLSQFQTLSNDAQKTWDKQDLTRRIFLALYTLAFLLLFFLLRYPLKRATRALSTPQTATTATSSSSKTATTPASLDKLAAPPSSPDTSSTSDSADIFEAPQAKDPTDVVQPESSETIASNLQAPQAKDPTDVVQPESSETIASNLQAPQAKDPTDVVQPESSETLAPILPPPSSIGLTEAKLTEEAAKGLRTGFALILRATHRVLAFGLLFAALLTVGWVFSFPQNMQWVSGVVGTMLFGLRLLWVSADLLFAKAPTDRLLANLNDQDARAFRRLFKGMALFAFLNYPILLLAPLAQYPITFVHILESLFVAGILFGVLYLFLKKEPILALIPTDTAFGARTALIVRRVYPVFYVLAIGIFGIFVAGYRSLAIFLTIRTLLSVVLLLSAYSIQLLIWTLAMAIVSRFQGNKGETKRTQNNLLRLLRLAVTLLTALITLSLLLETWDIAGGYKAVLNLLDTPFFQIEKTQISVVSIFKLLISVFGSFWLSAWLKQRLHHLIYPLLRFSLPNRHAADTVVHYSTIILGVLVGLQWMGVGIGVLAVFAGVIGIGIGFGTQDIANNFISGLILTFGQSVKVGDVIEVNGILGTVREISARSTTVESPDGRIVLLPNATLLTSSVINWSMGPSHIIATLQISVATENTPRTIQDILLRIAQQHPQILQNPAPYVQLEDFNEENIDFTLQVAVQDPLQRFVLLSDLRFAINETFAKLGIKLARSSESE
ncbi:mechanosensitive ion channel [Myxococcota bacterium]|nr:mechanosensitive ion channel [Myxococcota bacterium]